MRLYANGELNSTSALMARRLTMSEIHQLVNVNVLKIDIAR